MTYSNVVIYLNNKMDVLSVVKMAFANAYDIEANRPDNCSHYKVLKKSELSSFYAEESV
jgi:hypothetical protein